MNKIALGLFLAFFLLLTSITIAIAFEFDNIKSYDVDKKEVVIDNVFGLGYEIARIQLTSELNEYVLQGKDRKVAELLLVNFDKDYKDYLDKMETYDILNGMEKIDRKFTYKYRVLIDEKEITQTETDCKDPFDPTSCKTKEIGKIKVPTYEWIPFTQLSELPKDNNVTIGIFTDVYSNEHIEWIPTFFGVKVNEWASWTSSLNVGLTRYYKFDESSGTNINESVFGRNMTTVNSPIWNTTDCKIGNCIDFDGSSNYAKNATAITDLVFGRNNRTMAGWFRNDIATANDDYFITYGQGLVNYESWFLRYGYGGGVTNHLGIMTWTGEYESSAGMLKDTWYHIAYVYDGTSVLLYVNGALNGTGAVNATTINHWQLIFGARQYQASIDGYANVKLDEWGFWNRTLSASEISDLYNGGSGITYTDYFPSGNFSVTPYASNPSGTITTTNPVFQYNITSTDSLYQCVWNWNGLNTSVYSAGDNKLIAGFDFDNVAGIGDNATTVVDITGRYNGTLYNYFGTENYSTGKYDDAIGFNGTNQHVWVEGLQNIGLENYNFSVEFWIKTGTQDDMVVAHGRNAGSNNGWIIGTGGSTSLDIQVWNSTDSSVRCVDWNSCTASGTLPTGTWKHVLVNFDIDGKNMSAYIDGTIVGSTTWLGGLQVQNNNFTIGVRTPNQNPFAGYIDKFRLYNQTFSSAQIQQLYYSNLNKYNNTLYGFYVNETISTAGVYPFFLYCNDSSSNSDLRSSSVTYDATAIIVNGSAKTNITRALVGVNIGRTNFLVQRENGIAPWYENKSASDVQTFRNYFFNASMGIIRMDMALENTAYSESSINSSYIDYMRNVSEFLNTYNIEAVLVATYTPPWMPNLTAYSCSTNKTCLPNNLTMFSNLQWNFINQSNLNNAKVYVEGWNEPDLSNFLLSGVAESVEGATNRSLVFNSIWKAGYDKFNAVGASAKYIGGAFAQLDDPNKGATVSNYWYKNFTTNISTVSQHTYGDDWSGRNLSALLAQDAGFAVANCTTYGSNCGRIITSETGTFNSTINLNPTYQNESHFQFAGGLIYLLLNRQNDSLIFYEFGDADGEDFGLINETSLKPNNVYNTIANFTRVVKPSNKTLIYNASLSDGSTNMDIAIAKYYDTCGIVLVNKGATKNVTLPNLTSAGLGCSNNFTDLITGNNYTQGQNYGNVPYKGTLFLASQQTANDVEPDGWTNLTACQIINVSGSYRLQNDIWMNQSFGWGASGQACFSIEADNVLVQGNGKNIFLNYTSGNSAFAFEGTTALRNNISLYNIQGFLGYDNTHYTSVLPIIRARLTNSSIENITGYNASNNNPLEIYLDGYDVSMRNIMVDYVALGLYIDSYRMNVSNVTAAILSVQTPSTSRINITNFTYYDNYWRNGKGRIVFDFLNFSAAVNDYNIWNYNISKRVDINQPLDWDMQKNNLTVLGKGLFGGGNKEAILNTSATFYFYDLNSVFGGENMSNVTIFKDGSPCSLSICTNITIDNSTNGGTVSFKTLNAQGTYNVSVLNYTDVTPPAVTITYPTNTTYSSVVTALNYTYGDASSCWYSTNNWATNTSITCGTNVTGLTSSQGSNTWGVGVNDSFGNLNFTTVVFYDNSDLYISSCEDLQNISSNLNSNYYLTNDIDCSGVDFEGISYFNGSLNGNNYSINNLLLNNENGLFTIIGVLGLVKDVILQNFTSYNILSNDTGSIVGTNYGTILNTGIEGNLTHGGGLNDRMGGFVGTNYGTINSSYFKGLVYGYSTSSPGLGSIRVGGFVGANFGNISNSYTIANITGRTGVSLFGLAYSGYNINKTYQVGSISYSFTSGKYVSDYDIYTTCSDAYVSDSFWENSSGGTCGGSTGITPTLMRTQSTFESNNWDFSDIWSINSTINDGYPYLSWREDLGSNITIELITPTDGATISNLSNVLVNTISTFINIKNSTFKVWNSTNSLVFSLQENINKIDYSIGINSTNLSRLPDGTYQYNVTSCDYENLCVNSPTFSFTLDTDYPTVSILSPVNGSIFTDSTMPYNVSLEFSVSGGLVDSCWYNNETANVSITCGSNTSINLNQGFHQIIFYANTTTGLLSSATSGFNISKFNSGVFNIVDSELTEGNIVNMNLTIDASYINSTNATITFNNTLYYPSIHFSNSTLVKYNLSISAPYVTNNTLMYGWANYSVNGVNFNSDIENITIKDLTSITVAVDCNDTAVRFYVVDEENFTSLSATVAYNIKYGTTNTTSEEMYGKLTGVSNFSICINSTASPNYTIGYAEFDYSTNGYVDRRYYLYDDTVLTNQTNNITLYDLASAVQTSFKLDVEDSSLNPYVGYYTQLLRWYPDLNEYRVVDMGKTDQSGTTVIHVRTEDVDYRVGVYETDGTLIKLDSPTRMICLVDPCTYTLKVTPEDVDYTSFLGVDGLLTYNATSKIFRYVYSDSSQKTSGMNLTVYKDTGTSTITVCSDSAASYTGVLTCDISAYQSGTFRAVVKRSASPETPIAQKIINMLSSSLSGGFTLWLSILIGIPVIFVFAFASPTVAIIGGVVALIPAYFFGVINFTILGGFAVLAGIVAHFLKRAG